jgi:alanine dehydrogenase
MRIGVPKETKVGETRVGLTSSEVGALAHAGHDVFVQQGAGLGVNIDDVAFAQAGAEIVADAATLWARSELIAKVKELQAAELPHVRPGVIVAGFAQLARDRTMLHAICERGATLLAYECVLDAFDKELVPARTLTVTREFSFSDAQALAKEGEERLLRADMQNDLVTQILRQLQAARRAP